MKTKLLFTVPVVLALLSFNSCSKSTTDNPDPNNPGTAAQIPSSGILYVNDFIYAMNVDGTNPVKLSLSKENFDEDYPSSSADGKKIVFRRYSKGIIVKDATGEKVIMNDANTPIFPTWAGNSKIFYTRFNGVTQNGKDYVYSVNADGTGEAQVSPVYNNVATPSDEGASISPDNAYVIFSTNRTGNGGTIMKVKLSDGSSSYLTYSGNTLGESVICPAEHPTWSPNGAKIAFAAYPGYPDFSAKEQIYLMNPDGSGKIKLTNETAANCIYPSWSPDGTKIVFQKNYPGFSNCYEIWIMNADGSNAKALTDRNKTGYETHPAFIGKPR